jgi:RecA-family ATPase
MEEHADLGVFETVFASWSRILSISINNEVRLSNFRVLCGEAVSCVSKGLERGLAVEELFRLADAHGLVDELGAENVEAIVARAFEEPHEQPKANGKGHTGPQIIYVDIAREPLPERKWAVRDRIPAGNVTLISGEGAIGKTILLLQLAAATVLGKDWIGTMPERGPVLFLSCEDDDDEICRRLEGIAKHYGATRADLASNGLWVISRVGKDSVLGFADRHDLIQPAPLFPLLKAEIERIRPVTVMIDTAADTFGGNEISRSQTRQFITLLRSLVVPINAALILSAHPSLSGITSDSGLSGSTAWHNSVRARMYFKKADGDDKALRVLVVKKNNYGPEEENVSLKWKDGAYVFPETPTTIEKAVAESVFLNLLRRFAAAGRDVSDKPSANYAPTTFASEAEAKTGKLDKKALAEAMSRLFADKKIRVEWSGPKSRKRSRLVECAYSNATSNEVPTASNGNVADGHSNAPSNASNTLNQSDAHTPSTPDPVGRSGFGPGSGKETGSKPDPFQRGTNEG